MSGLISKKNFADLKKDNVSDMQRYKWPWPLSMTFRPDCLKTGFMLLSDVNTVSPFTYVIKNFITLNYLPSLW